MTAGPEAVCIVCGAISGNLEMIDFDCAGEAYEAWRAMVEEIEPGLVDRLFVESTPSGGRHVVYRCESPVCGNTKLAQRRVDASGDAPVVIGGKTLTAGGTYYLRVGAPQNNPPWSDFVYELSVSIL